jgi:hypothetical protein
MFFPAICLKMTAKKNKINQNIPRIITICLLLVLSACSTGRVEVTPSPISHFVPPLNNQGLSAGSTPLSSPPPTRQVNCQNQLKFIEDVTIPDGTQVLPGEKITKRWLVANAGSCNWDKSYSLELISGLALGADIKQTLYPARQNTEFILEIEFNAPENPGRYNSWWQAFDPDQNRFGDPVYIDIAVVEEINGD